MQIIHPDGFQILVAIDQLINTCIGGYADETLSSRTHRRLRVDLLTFCSYNNIINIQGA